MKPLNKLGLAAVIGFPCCIAAYHLFRTKVSSDIKSTRIYEEAIAALRQHRGAIYLLGQPISDSTAQFNSFGVSEERRMDVKIGVAGPKSKGVLFYSTVADDKNDVQLDTVQLQVGKDDTKRLVIKKSWKEINSNSSNNETGNSSSNDETKNGFTKVEINKTSPNFEATNSTLQIESSSSENS